MHECVDYLVSLGYCRQWIDLIEPFFVCNLSQRYGWSPAQLKNEICACCRLVRQFPCEWRGSGFADQKEFGRGVLDVRRRAANDEVLVIALPDT